MMPKVNWEPLQVVVAGILGASGVPPSFAQRVSESLVASDLAGHDSHGVVRVFQYLKAIETGEIDPNAVPKVVHETDVVTLIDGGHGFGQVAAHRAMSMAIEKASASGLSAAGIHNCGHVGRLGEWVAMAADEGLIGVGFSNGGIPGGLVAPYGGKQPALGTNPIAAAFPVQGREPVLIDFASSSVAEGKVRVARNEGASVPEGWILDVDGRPTTDPNALYEGGMLVPAAGHKGYGLSLTVEFLGGLLTGAGCAILPGFTPGNGIFLLVISVESFRPRRDFEEQAAELVTKVKAIQPAPGFEEILVPGEPEQRTRNRRAVEGIPLDDGVWAELKSIASAEGIEIPADLLVRPER